MINRSIIMSGLCFFLLFPPCRAFATTETVQQEEPAYKYASPPPKKVSVTKVSDKSKMVPSVTAGIIQGYDSNPLLDSTKKADTYTQETVDLHFTYPLKSSKNEAVTRFGLNVMNINYYKVREVDIFDGVADLNLEQQLSSQFSMNAGYAFEWLWFPSSRDGNYLGNEINAGLKNKISDKISQKLTYRCMLRNYTDRKSRLDNGALGSKLRIDLRNVLQHELDIYLAKSVKVKFANQFYINESNDQYFDYYDYYNYRTGASLVTGLTKGLYNITAFYYQRRNYSSRRVSDRESRQKDNLYLATTSFLYDITKDVSLFLTYSHSENHTNEVLEKYGNNVYSLGLYYSF